MRHTAIPATRLERLSGAAALLLLLQGCNDPQAKQSADAVVAADQDCLLLVWDKQQVRDEEYDRANDKVEGGAISCVTGSTPTQFRAAIADLQAAARSGDRKRMLRELGLPLLYIDANGKSRELKSPEMVEAAFDEVFDATTLQALGRMDLKHMTVVPEQGAFFELGSLWLVVPEPGARPRLVTVNQQALSEAAAAVRRKAESNSR